MFLFFTPQNWGRFSPTHFDEYHPVEKKGTLEDDSLVLGVDLCWRVTENVLQVDTLQKGRVGCLPRLIFQGCTVCWFSGDLF